MRRLLILIPVIICLAIFIIAAQVLSVLAPPPVQAAEIPAALGIYGTVTYAGVPSGSVSLDLWFADDTSFTIISSTLSAADGTYSFKNMPALNNGESYFVEYYNSILDPEFLYYWDTRVITQYLSGQDLYLGTFDIQNVVHLAPLDFATVQFPVDFSWVARNIPTDKYQIRIQNLSGSEYISPILNYTDTFHLDQLPNTLAYNSIYFWDMLVFSPDGGVGNNTEWYQITFTNTQQFPFKLYIPMISK